MVKIRGFRVEPSEVEDAIAKVDGVAEVGVLAHPGDDGGRDLAAVVTVHRPEVNPTVIRLRASELLPQPLVPTTVLVRDSLPHIANGKLDRRALTAIVTAARDVESSRPARAAPEPAAGTDQRLRVIRQAGLRTRRSSADSFFFTLGGTSISAPAVISPVPKASGA